MTVWVMWLVAAVVVLLPLALMMIFHGSDVADSRGRRISRRWRRR
ncbi:hypothetical protein BH23ACT10_BH23ACT10_12420 [soil metagenome]